MDAGNQPTVAVVIITYNQEAFIAEAIQSVAAQSWDPIECIVVDDGSKDGSAVAAREVAKAFPWCRAYVKENGGPSSARNFGAAQVSDDTEFLVFLDGDDVLHTNFIQTLAGHLQKCPKAGLVACQFSAFDDSPAQAVPGHRSRYAPGRLGLPRVMRADEIVTPFVTFFCATGMGPFALYRRSVYEQTAGWDESFWPHEDTDMFCQMALQAEVHFLPDHLYLKRTHQTNIMGMQAQQAETAFTHFKRDAYGTFRKKWDAITFEGDHAKNRLLSNARQYYYGMFRPCRHLKVAKQAIGDFLRKPSRGVIRWFFHLICEATGDFLRYGVLKLSPNKPAEK